MPRFTFVSVENNISEYNVLWEKIRSLRSLYDTVVKHIRVKKIYYSCLLGNFRINYLY